MTVIAQTNPKALKSIIGTVARAATAATQFIDAGSVAAEKLDLFMKTSLSDQKMRTKKHNRLFAHQLVAEATEERALADLRVVEFRAQSEDHAKLYDDAHNEFTDLFAEELGLAKS